MRICLLLIILVTTTFGCSKEPMDDEAETTVTPVDTCQQSYNTSIMTIIESNCLNCHSGTFAPNLSSYQNVTSNSQRIMIRAVFEKTMPPPGGAIDIQQSERDALECWINEGMPQ